MKRQGVKPTVTLVLAMLLCVVRGKGLWTDSAFVVSMSRPRVRTAKRPLPLGTLRQWHGLGSSAKARWRHSTLGPEIDAGVLPHVLVMLPTRGAMPLSTLDRHSSSFSPQHPQDPDVVPVARSPSGGHPHPHPHYLRSELKITLTDKEERLFATLLNMVEAENMGTTLRVAGGWVRDKLIGQEERVHQRKLDRVEKMDIDIALDNCMGGDFAVKLSRYLSGKQKGLSRTSKVALIASNPEKSKHLETATLRIDDFWVDFVNLRTESYLQDSRIPSINIGTPEEDAFRRDLTINSLFYNVNTNTVEDYTGKGTADLSQGLVRTPLPACETLLDDPLRVLRAVRFASRFGFRVHPELLDAGRDPRVHEALCNKVSRERVGCELDQMIRSASPLRAFKLMDDMRLLPLVFPLPRASDPELLPADGGSDRGSRDSVYEMGMVYLKNMHHLLDTVRPELEGFNPFGPRAHPQTDPPAKGAGRQEDLGGAAATATRNDRVLTENKGGDDVGREEVRRLALYAAFLLPLAETNCSNSKGVKVPLIQVVMGEQLKLRAKDSTKVLLLTSAATEFQLLLRKTIGNAGGTVDEALPVLRGSGKATSVSPRRLPAGLILREVGCLWRAALLLGLTGDLGTKRLLADDSTEEDTSFIPAYGSMGRSIEDMRLEGVWNLKPMFNGGEVMKILPNLPRGPLFSEVMKEQIEWMISHPGATKEEGRGFVKTRFAEFCSSDSATS